jgi:hypothetical protein
MLTRRSTAGRRHSFHPLNVEREILNEYFDPDPPPRINFGKESNLVAPHVSRDTISLSELYVALAIRPTNGAGTASVSRLLLDLLAEPPALLLCDKGRVFALLAAGEVLGQPAQRSFVFRRLHRALQTANGRVAVAWSCVHAGVNGWRHALDEASHALSMVIRVLGAGAAAGYAEVTVMSLVLGAHDPAHVRALQDHLLGPICDYDQTERADLIPTLETYLENACNASRTAEVLRVHRNSVANRLQKIKELCDVDLDDADMRLLMQLILCSARGLNTTPGSVPSSSPALRMWADAIDGILRVPALTC